jgi:hypothetical protein
MNHTFTIDEDIIRRLALRQEQDDRPAMRNTRLRSLLSWRGSTPVRKPRASLTARTRWS